MPRVKAILAAILFSVSLVLFTCLLLLVVIPEYHGSLFQFGRCQITNHTTDYEQGMEWKECTCGVFCSSKYPCSSVTGTFTPVGDGKHRHPRHGTFYSDYAALIRGCYKFPYTGECRKRPSANKHFIEVWTNMLPNKFDNKTFDCYGLGESVYPFQSNAYHAQLGHIAFFPPLLLVILGFVLLFKSSEGVRASTCCVDLGERWDVGEEEETVEPLLRPAIDTEGDYKGQSSNSLSNPSAPLYDDELPPPYQI